MLEVLKMSLYYPDGHMFLSAVDWLVLGQFCLNPQMCFEWFTKGQHDLESDVQQQLFKEKILKLESYEITMNGRESLQLFVLDFFLE